MHEMSIAAGLMEQIEEIVKENHIVIVNEVFLEAGVLRQIVPEVMQEAFEAVKQGTVCRKAVLHLKEIKAIAKCKDCGNTFEPKFDDFLCNNCNIANVEILQGNEILLMSINGNTQD